MPIAHHPARTVTPQLRAEQLSDEFIVKSNQLFCKWCKKVLISLRNDNLKEHLHSRIHQENRMNNGARMSFDPDDPQMQHRRNMTKKANARRKERLSLINSQGRRNKIHQRRRRSKTSQADDDSSQSSSEQLSLLFEDSDSEDDESFEGFEESEDQQSVSSKRSRGRPHKRPARLSDTFDSTGSNRQYSSGSHSSSSPPKKRRKQSFSDSSPSSIPLHTMPLKKQMSYNARTNTSSRKKAKLKIKIRRKSEAQPKSFQVESSDAEHLSPPHVTSYKGVGDGLKMKFVLDKHADQNIDSPSPHKHKKKLGSPETYSRQDSSYEEQSYNYETPEIASPLEEKVHKDYQQSDNMFVGIEEVVEEEIVQDDGVEVVEEEIVGVDEGEVVSWDAVVVDNQLEDVAPPAIDTPPSPDLSSEQTLAIKANYAREMAKAVNSAQFKRKRLVAKKQEAKVEEKAKTEKNAKVKRKISGYNLWSSKMRKQVAHQYPGLQFGDISKKMGELWKKIPDKEKQMWRNRGDKRIGRVEDISATANSTKRNKGSRMIETGPKKKIALPKQTPKSPPLPAFPPHKIPELTMQRELNKLPLPTLEPIDAASHLHLLGQSMINMGNQAKSYGNPVSSDKLVSTLLDSLLCSFAPLMSLVNQVPQLQGAVPEETMVDTFANLAHVMPGL